MFLIFVFATSIAIANTPPTLEEREAALISAVQQAQAAEAGKAAMPPLK
jgi:hypothetical protein